jgi:ATP-citrate lyase beta-subunit
VPRKKLSEYRSKVIVHEALGLPYIGWTIDTEAPIAKQLSGVNRASNFAVKVDQGVKGRQKKGLVQLGVSHAQLPQAARQLHSQGYRWLIIEPMFEHQTTDERYLSLNRTRSGVSLSWSRGGGINVESHADGIQSERLDDRTDWRKLGEQTGLGDARLRGLVDVFNREYMSFLEINPYIVTLDGLRLLDLAVEVDDAGAYFVDNWTEADFRRAGGHNTTPEEQVALTLDENSPASFKLDVLNPNGAIFLLLSGGGASITVADEVYNQGHGRQLANYGEYSGNPNSEETYLYTSAVLKLLLASKAPKKVLFIGGAVANFTDIANTFSGVIQAIDAVAKQLTRQHVKVYVRRGGPRQEIGLAKIRAALEAHGLLGAVHGPETSIVDAVTETIKEIA